MQRLSAVLFAIMLLGCSAGHVHARPVREPTLTLTTRVVDLKGKLSLTEVAKVANKLLELDAVSQAPIYLRVNAYGNSIEAAYALADTVGAISSPVHAVVQSRAYAAAAVVVAACARVYVFPNAIIMFRAFEKVSVDAQADDPPEDPFKQSYLDRVHTPIARRLRVTLGDFQKKAAKGWWLDANEAVRLGAADVVVERLKYRELFEEKTEVKRTVTRTVKKQLPPVPQSK